MLPDLQCGFLSILHQEVPNILIVNLQHGESHFKGGPGALLGIDIFEYCIGKHWNESFVDTIAKDRVTLAATSLPIGKQRSIESLPGIGDQTLSQVIEHFALVHILGIIDLKISVFSKEKPLYNRRF